MKRLLFLVVFLLSFAVSQAGPDSISVANREMKVDSIIQKAASYLCVNYCRGGVGRDHRTGSEDPWKPREATIK